MIKLPLSFNIYPVIETDNLALPLDDFLDQLISAGVNIIQLRDKFHTANDRYLTALKIKKFLDTKNDIIFIINDNIDIALSVGATGVHLGIKDLPIDIAKAHFSNLIFGYSCNNLIDVASANKSADYAAIGPCFYTDTKKDLRDILSSEVINELINGLNLPVFAIGGITDKNINDIHNYGFVGAAVSSYITSSKTPYETVKKLYKAGLI